MKILIWERYFLKEILKVFFLFLFAFFFLYCAIDYSLHMQDFIQDKKIQFGDIALYYGFQFIKRSTLLLPLALLIASIKVLTSLNAHRELMTLQVSALSFKRLMRPFFFLAVVCTLFNFCATEFFLPRSLTYLDRFYDKHFKHKQTKKYPVRSMVLKDNSKLLYQHYDPTKEAFFDVVWLESPSSIWRMKYLSSTSVGEYVDHLERGSEGLFEKKESMEKREFKKIAWEKNLPRKGFIPTENRSLSQLYQFCFQKKNASYLKGELLTNFYYKCAMPLLPLVVVAACTPFCVQYARKIPLFLLYSLSLFGFISFFTLMDAALILGENRVTAPFWAIFIPFVGCSLPFAWNFFRHE